MDNKIKIVASFIWGLLCLVSCAFDGNLGFYEIKINDWAKITYWLQNKNDTANLRGFELYATQRNLKIDKRYDLDDYHQDNRILQMPNRVVYNNKFIISDDGYANSESCEYYIVTPIEDRGGGKLLPFTTKKITRQEYDSIEVNCKDCKIMDTAKLQKLHYNLEQEKKNSFPTKTVVFFTLIFVYIFYRIYKKKKAKKSNRK